MKNLFASIKKQMQEKREKELISRSKELFQICEYEGETWLTYDSHLVLPTAFLERDPILVLSQLRKAYIERNKV